VRVLAPGSPSWHERDLAVKLESISTVPLLKFLWHFPETAHYLIANRRIIRYQTLHLCQQGPLRVMMVLRLLGLVRPKRLIVTLHGSELFQLRSSRIGGRWLLRKLLDRTDRVAVLSQWVRDELAQHYPSIIRKTVVAPGATRSGWPFASRKITEPDSRLTVLTVGRIHPRKGQHTILEALGRLEHDQQKGVRYLIVGPVVSCTYAKVLSKLAQNTATEVIFCGEVDDAALRKYYAAADIFVLTSELQPKSVEGFGLVYLEASASGLPILGHRTGGVEYAVQDGVTGLLIEPGDKAGLDSALATLVEDAALRERLGANGRKWAEKFSWDQCAEAVYGDLP